MRYRVSLVVLLLLILLGQGVFSESSCQVLSEFPLTYPGAAIEINISYSGFTFPTPIVVICRPNSPRFCFVGPGSGECRVFCDYPYKGLYTVTATSLTTSCKPFLVVSDPEAKPTCTLTPGSARGNGTLITQITARFTGILPNTTGATIDCGNGAPASKVGFVGRTAQVECKYSAETKKEVFTPAASSGGANCASRVTVVPSSDSMPPHVSFYNLTYRAAVRDTLNISINASDNVEVDRVELYINKMLVKTMRTAPYWYLFTVSNYTNGTAFLVEARAVDIYGNSNATLPYIVTKALEGDRSCNITASPIYAPIPAAIKLKAVFHNTSSNVLYAFFKPNYLDTAINTSGPQTPIFNGTAETSLGYGTAGVYYPYVTDGNITCTTKIYITATPDVIAPVVSLTNPVNNQDIRIGDTIELAATASDNVVVTGIGYYLDDRLIANSTSSPFNATWNTSGEHIGFYNVRAIAYDAAGNPSTIPSKALVILFTNRTCSISPQSVMLLSKTPANFSVACFNFTRANFSFSITNRTTTNFTENFTIESQELLGTMLSKITCPEMEWSSSLYWSDITPKISPFAVIFTPQEAEDLLGTITATDKTSGFSCSARFRIVNDIPACAVKLDSPAIVGERIQVAVVYDNLTKSQEFRITCRPNIVTSCFAASGKGSCNAYCDYPTTGRFFVTASSPSLTCASKGMSVLPHPDKFPPVISITRPFNRQIINGVERIEAYATDNFGVQRVDFLVDSEIAHSDELTPYEFNFNTTRVRNGDHTVTARAFDESGNSMDYSITVTVAN